MTVQSLDLTGIPETMLWTLHNRASEAARPDGVLRDELALQIYRAVRYDYERSFGPPDSSHGVRSAVFDGELRWFLNAHPDGVVVNLGEGLETQRFRVDSDAALWLCVDVPEAIAVRERFIQPDARHLHLAMSAFDRAWIDRVPAGRAVYVTAQGLLMYFEPRDVEALFRDLAARLPGAWFAFDHIPGWISRKTLRGWWKTPHYRTPPMPWGIDRHLVAPTLRAWVPALTDITTLPFILARGVPRMLFKAVMCTPGLNRYVPGITRVRFPGESP
jgi:O-methyltransferase involved in polyketide biosynthesis